MHLLYGHCTSSIYVYKFKFIIFTKTYHLYYYQHLPINIVLCDFKIDILNVGMHTTGTSFHYLWGSLLVYINRESHILILVRKEKQNNLINI